MEKALAALPADCGAAATSVDLFINQVMVNQPLLTSRALMSQRRALLEQAASHLLFCNKYTYIHPQRYLRQCRVKELMKCRSPSALQIALVL